MVKVLGGFFGGFLVVAAGLSQVAGGPASSGTGAMPSAAIRVGVIHVERLLQESALGKEALKRIQRLSDQKREEAERFSKELQGLELKLADQGPSLNAENREFLQKSFQDKTIAFRRFQDDASRELEGAKNRELATCEFRSVLLGWAAP